MSAPRSDFLKVLTERGFIHQTSDFEGIDAAAAGRAAHGLCRATTAPRLRSMSGIAVDHDAALAAEDRAGKPIALMGGGTTRVGDPSGRTRAASLLTPDQIEANKASIRRVFSHSSPSATADATRSWSTTPNG